jgi:hypothetical protein
MRFPMAAKWERDQYISEGRVEERKRILEIVAEMEKRPRPECMDSICVGYGQALEELRKRIEEDK